MLLTGALGAAVGLALPPAAAAAPDQRAENGAAPQERRTPPPAPTGCPFRNGKLELIA